MRFILKNTSLTNSGGNLVLKKMNLQKWQLEGVFEDVVQNMVNVMYYITKTWHLKC